MSAAEERGCLPWILMLASIVPLSIIHGAVLMKLWEWFVAGPFDVREIGLPLAIGLTAIATALTLHPNDGDSDVDPWQTLIKMWFFRLTASGLLLVEGLIVSRWV